MSVYDRDYYRDDEDDRSRRRRGKGIAGWSAVATLIALNVGLFFLNQGTGSALFDKMALVGTTATNPLQWYRCLTYAFAHDPNGLGHIFCNMLVLFFFGRIIEMQYGKREFTLFYLLSALFGGLVWNVLNFGDQTAALGASGAISAIVILFALNYPREQVLFFGILPMPAWLMGVAYVVFDMIGTGGGLGADGVAHNVHLSGAVFALLYYLLNVNFSELSIGRGRGRKSLKKLFGGKNGKKSTARTQKSDSGSTATPTISVGSRWSKVDPTKGQNVADAVSFEKLEATVDRILLKIKVTGEESLTDEERDTLRRASLEYQKRQRKN